MLVIDSMVYENGGLNDLKITVLAGSSIFCLLCKVINQTSVEYDEEFHHTPFAECQMQNIPCFSGCLSYSLLDSGHGTTF